MKMHVPDPRAIPFFKHFIFGQMPKFVFKFQAEFPGSFLVSMSKSAEEAQNLPQMLRALNSVCSELNLIPVQGESYISENRKWIVEVVRRKDGEVFVLEFFAGLHRGLRFKFLDDGHLLGFDFMRQFVDIHCFGYKRSTSIPDLIANERSVRVRENAIVSVLPNMFTGMIMLTSQRLWHQKLTLDNVCVLDDDEAKIGALELVMPEGEVQKNAMASLAHLPPELLAYWSLRERSLIKAQMWVVGSQVLELLIGKHMSGEAFQPHHPEAKLTRRLALKNIRRNVRYLPFVLAASDLSIEMQEFLTCVLSLKPERRMNLLQAVMYFRINKDCASTIVK